MTAPKKLKETLAATVAAMCAAYGISAADAQAGCTAMFAEWEGRNTNALTNRQPLDRVLSAAQVAALLGRSRKTVTELAKRGKIRAVKIGANGQRASGYSEDSVRAFIEGKAA